MQNKYLVRHVWRLQLLHIAFDVIVFAFFGVFAFPTSAQRSDNVPDAVVMAENNVQPVPDVVLVKLSKKAITVTQTHSQANSVGIKSIDDKLKHKVVRAEKLLKTQKQGNVDSDAGRWIKIRVTNPGQSSKDSNGNTTFADVDAIIETLKSDPNVEAVEKDQQATLFNTPNDPFYSTSGNILPTMADMYGLGSINAEQAWDITTGSSDVVVAVIDSGVDYTHPDLADNIWVNTAEIPANGIDDDLNGYIDDLNGWDYDGNRADVNDVLGHGTHVAGTIAATGNNGLGVVGVSWNTKIMALRICGSDGLCSYADAAQAMMYAADNGAKVTNNSYGGLMAKTSLSYVRDAMQYAHDAGVSTVVAAGNNNVDMVAGGMYPAIEDDAITVSAIDHLNNRASFSNYGDKVDVAAPGVRILSTKSTTWTYGTGPCPAVFGGTYCYLSGTSMAAPHVAGLVSLMYAVNPSITPEQVRQVLRASASDLGTVGKDAYYGYGLAKAHMSVSGSSPANVLTPYINSPKYTESIGGLCSVTGSITGPGFVSYLVQIGMGDSPSTWTTLGSSTIQPTTLGTLATYNCYNLSNEWYTLRVTATNDAGKTFTATTYSVYVYSPSDSVAPSTPTNLSGVAAQNSIQLAWTASTDNIGVQGYVVKRDGVTIGTPTTNSFVSEGLTPGTSYSFSVQAKDLAGNLSTGQAIGTYTTSADTQSPSAPGTITATDVQKRSVTLSWVASTDNVGVTGYRIYRGGVLVHTQLATTWQDTSLSIASSYAYGVEAFDAAGNTSARSGFSISTLADTSPPTISISSPVSGDTLRRSTLVALTAEDDEAVASVDIYRGESIVKSFASGGVSMMLNVIGLADGPNAVKITATDTAGNKSELTRPVVIGNPKRGDINDDGRVNIFDLSRLLSGWSTTDISRDLDGNDEINIFDLSILLSQYGT